MICNVCGVDHPHGFGVGFCLEYGSQTMCYGCMIMQDRCEVCGKRRHSLVDGICPDCRPQVGEVPTCGAPPPPPIITRELGKPKKCYLCGEYKTRTTELDGKNVCRTCLGASSTCRACGKLAYTCQGYCRDCHKKLTGYEHRWNYRPIRFRKWGNRGEKLLFGVENEVQMEEGFIKRTFLQHIISKYYFDEAYTMYDGTISYGTEVVFHPRSFKEIKNFNFTESLRGVVPHPSTGMHVHISRGGFESKTHLYKFMRFFAKNKGFTEMIAERKSGGIRKWAFTEAQHIALKLKGRHFGEEKYIDVNMKHAETVEVRIFKGATSQEQILKNVEFCHAVCMYSKSHLPKEMTKIKFLQWLEGKSESYGNLINFIGSKTPCA